jgi:two-component system, response regulator
MENMRPLNIFHIDDNDDDALLLSRVLRRSQHPTTLKWFPSAREAIDFLEEARATDMPDLIFCDLRMRGISGHDFIRWLRQSKWQTVTVIVLSWSDLIEDIRAAYELGANSFLTKPLVAAEILKVLQDAGECRAVVSRSAEPSLDGWRRRPDGGRHTWSDDEKFWNWFERVTDNAA